MKFHPLAELFPLLEEPELARLAADILENGLRQPILVHKGQIIDGRNRYLACKKSGVEPDFQEMPDTDPAKFVASLNLHRRHLDDSQRTMIAASIVSLIQGQKKADLPDGRTQADAAKALNVSVRGIARAAKVLENGSEKLKAKVMSGDVSVTAAANLSRKSKRDQNKELATGKRPFSSYSNEPVSTGAYVTTDKPEPDPTVHPIVQAILDHYQQHHAEYNTTDNDKRPLPRTVIDRVVDLITPILAQYRPR